MGKTIKFTISMSEEDFEELESLRQRTGKSRSQFMRDAVRTWKEEFMRPLGIKEETGEYKREIPSDLINLEERRQRAIAAAGRFRSDISDISLKHDEHLEEIYAEIAQKKDKEKIK
jgi:metal-responsive CopG/Arc/MetJ family transcriptional regulator